MEHWDVVNSKFCRLMCMLISNGWWKDRSRKGERVEEQREGKEVRKYTRSHRLAFYFMDGFCFQKDIIVGRPFFYFVTIIWWIYFTFLFFSFLSIRFILLLRHSNLFFSLFHSSFSSVGLNKPHGNCDVKPNLVSWFSEKFLHNFSLDSFAASIWRWWCAKDEHWTWTAW